jgi:hypothetical protein
MYSLYLSKNAGRHLPFFAGSAKAKAIEKVEMAIGKKFILE